MFLPVWKRWNKKTELKGIKINELKKVFSSGKKCLDHCISSIREYFEVDWNKTCKNK